MTSSPPSSSSHSSSSSSPLSPLLERAKKVIMNTIAYYDGNNNNNVTFAELEQELETAGLVVTENGYGYDAMSGAPRNAKQLEWLI